MRRAIALVLAAGALQWPAAAPAASLPAGFAETVVASGVNRATAMAFAPDGRLFVTQQGGQLRVIKEGTLLAAPFVALTVDSTGERGLLGVAFDPDFSSNQFVYVYHTVPATLASPARNRVSRFTAAGDVAVAGSERVIVELDLLSSATNHNGGAMHFAADGTLMIAVGDNASGSNAQSLGTRHGKMLRLFPDGSIPPDNPFVAGASGVNRAIWALGLRNPFTFAIQPGTGRLFINDVGQNAWEEINDGIAGANYGWPATEGYTSDPAYLSPFYAYPHAGGACAITGGAFYDPPVPQFPSTYEGWYFFADYCAGWIRRVHPSSSSTVTGFAAGISSPVDLKVGPDGALYYLARGSGAVFRIAYTQNQAPTIVTQPADRQVAVGQPATFSVTASGTPPLSYQWHRDGAAIAGATGSSYTLAVSGLGDTGATFQCVVSNDVGSATSHIATLTVIADQPPTATIAAPTAGTLYAGGQVITYGGSGSDPEDGPLPPGALSWRVDFHHDAHTHPVVPETAGTTGGSFTVPTVGETSTNVFYRIHLTVTDSVGLTHSTFVDVLPRTVTITLATRPTGLALALDGRLRAAPFSEPAVVGMTRTIAAPTRQIVGGVTYRFRAWSDGGAATHTIIVPPASTTYTAIYRRPK